MRGEVENRKCGNIYPPLLFRIDFFINLTIRKKHRLRSV